MEYMFAKLLVRKNTQNALIMVFVNTLQEHAHALLAMFHLMVWEMLVREETVDIDNHL